MKPLTTIYLLLLLALATTSCETVNIEVDPPSECTICNIDSLTIQ